MDHYHNLGFPPHWPPSANVKLAQGSFLAGTNHSAADELQGPYGSLLYATPQNIAAPKVQGELTVPVGQTLSYYTTKCST